MKYLIECWMDDNVIREVSTNSIRDAVRCAKEWYQDNRDPNDTNGSCRASVVKDNSERDLLYFEIGGTEVPPAGIIYNPPVRL